MLNLLVHHVTRRLYSGATGATLAERPFEGAVMWTVVTCHSLLLVGCLARRQILCHVVCQRSSRC